MTNLLCEVCQKNPSVGVACVPGVPYSARYCIECLKADAHPWAILVANTACLGGLANTANWWKEMVNHTCSRLGQTLDQFNREVTEAIKTMEGALGDPDNGR